MSFIEKNKVWLLPLLGLGILGVGYMNFRTLRSDPSPVASEPAPPEPPPAAAETSEAAEPSEDLWTDLRPFAILPGNLAQESTLMDRARVALGPELTPAAPLALGNPPGTSLRPAQKPEDHGTSLGVSGGEPPTLDFLIHSPHGSYAWFGGHAYRVGEKLQESGYTLSRIGSTFVELTGPQGRVVASTNPIHADAKNTSHPAETP